MWRAVTSETKVSTERNITVSLTMFDFFLRKLTLLFELIQYCMESLAEYFIDYILTKKTQNLPINVFKH